MKTTFKFIGAAVLGAAVLFGANSCNEAKSDRNGDKKAEESAKDTPAANAEESAKDTLAASTPSNLADAPIVYVDMTVLMSEYQMAIDLSTEVQAKINEMTIAFDNKKKSAEKEITKKQNNLQTKANDFQDKYSKGHLTETNANIKIQELQKLEEEYNTYLTQKDKELGEEQMKLQNTANEEIFVMNNKVNDAINTFIEKFRVENGYAMILISQSDVPNDGATTLGTPVLSADPSLDITAAVVAGLNAEYNASE
jgi:Skp family chaperone for outer membrane proteins